MLSIVHNLQRPTKPAPPLTNPESLTPLRLVAGRPPQIAPVKPPDLEQALTSPGAVFDSPVAVVQNSFMSRSTKREILRRWALDEHLVDLAEHEGMGNGPASRLQEVMMALLQIRDDRPPYPAAPAAFATRSPLLDCFTRAA
jgi:hypothetical protein